MNNYNIIRKDMQLHNFNLAIPWYCPISIKEKNNIPMIDNFPSDNISIFLSRKNIYELMQNIISLNSFNKTNISKEQNKEKLYILQQQIPIKMNNWATDNKINDYEDLNENILIRLNYLNKSFLESHGYLFDSFNKESVNVFQIDSDKVTDRSGKIFEKKYDEMLAQDYHTIDVHRPLNISKKNDNFRYNNAIPVWQKSMNTRHYDKYEIDGLQSSNSERASINTFSKGYDMSEIYKGLK